MRPIETAPGPNLLQRLLTNPASQEPCQESAPISPQFEQNNDDSEDEASGVEGTIPEDYARRAFQNKAMIDNLVNLPISIDSNPKDQIQSNKDQSM